MSLAGHPADGQLDAATWCGHLVPAGSVSAFLADHRQQLFPAELFADVTRHGGGHLSVPAEVIATVMVLQALEGLSDREAVGALRRDIAWKVACGLRLDDEGSIPRRWCPGATGSAPRPGPGGSSRRSARWWSRPGCSADGVGGCWTPPSWPTRSPPGHRHPAGGGDPPGRRLVAAAVRLSWPPTTMTVRASPSVPGMIRRPPRRWGRGWSTTRWRYGGGRGSRVGRRAGRGGRVAGLVAGQDVEPGEGREAGGSPARSPTTG
jgi:hypothetical protein